MPGHTNKPTEVWVEEGYMSVIAEPDGDVELRIYVDGHNECRHYITPDNFNRAVAEAFRQAVLNGDANA